jgi:hypothetical protein
MIHEPGHEEVASMQPGRRSPQECALLTILPPRLSPSICKNPEPALEEVMENFAELMERLLEIQSGGRPRSPKVIAEDKRLMDGLRKRNAGGKTQAAKADQDGHQRRYTA